MIKIIFITFISFLLLVNPVYSKEISQETIQKYVNKVANKFSRTYCNAINFGISNEGASSFAIGETNKEYKNNRLNNLLDYSLLKKSIISSVGETCQVYDFPSEILEKLSLG